MDRRASLALLMGKKEKLTTVKTTTTTLGTLNPYTGTWEFEQAAHLLRRTTFGPTSTQIKQAVTDGLNSTVNQLLMPQPMPDAPIYYDYEDDPEGGIGATWINFANNVDHRGPKNRSMRSWSMKVIQESGVSIREKMTLFWHNHFVVANTNDPRLRYHYINFLRENALGNFRTLVEGITIDPSMLQYLNGTQNTKNAPNENYARELMELFTLGKGESAGPGDYTTFTEDDVVELARALTGWRFRDFDDTTDTLIGARFYSNRHDITDKQLSHRFNNIVITDGGDEEYKTVIDIILQKDEVSRFMSRNIYRWLVGSEIDSIIETNIIEPMAQIMRDNNYEIEPVVRALLLSDHFYEATQIGCMINHPIDFLFKLINSLEIPFPTDLNHQYTIHRKIYNATVPLEMVLFSHPDVAGWKAFYQTPQYYRFWINAVTLQRRTELVDRLLQGYNTMGFRTEIDVLTFTASLDNPSDPNALINELAQILFPSPLEQEQIDALKEILIPGLPDFEWTVEYSDYASGNTTLEAAVESQLKALFGAMLKMPEIYLI